MSWALRKTPDTLRERYFAEGHWTDDTFASFIERTVAAAPDLALHIWSDVRPYAGTVGQVYEQSRRIAGGLQARGIVAGDVVAYQLPNWAEAIAMVWAGFRLGAVMVPIVHFYGAGEVEFILSESGAKAIVSVDRFGAVEHLENLESIRGRLPALEHVFVVSSGTTASDAPGMVPIEVLLEAAPIRTIPDIDPDGPAMLGYTSGTTANPKGVVHSHRSLLFETRQLAALDTASGRPTLVASPLAHMTGMLASNLVPLHQSLPLHLTDRWDVEKTIEIMEKARIGLGGGATVFLTALLDRPDFGPEHAALTPSIGLGGSPVPIAVSERAEARGIKVVRAYGSTEHPSISGSHPSDPAEKRNRTDGRALAGVELRLVDADGREVAPGQPGEILSRGPDLFAGYTDAELTKRVMTDEGFYRTGDVGVLDEDGYLTITDRLSDVIIRGGLNLSAAEIEEALLKMPSVTECAVVAIPDDTLGERACGLIRLRPGQREPSLEAVQHHLKEVDLPKQKWIEALHVVDEFPRTPSGKIRKNEIRAKLRRELRAGTSNEDA